MKKTDKKQHLKKQKSGFLHKKIHTSRTGKLTALF